MYSVERTYLKRGLGLLFLVGFGCIAWGVIQSFKPPEHMFLDRTREINLSNLQPGETLVTEWEGFQVFVLRRTNQQIEWLKSYSAPPLEKHIQDELPSPQLQNKFRSVSSEYLVLALWKNGQVWMLHENNKQVYPCQNFQYTKNDILVSQDIVFPGGFYCAKMYGNTISDMTSSDFVYDPAGRTKSKWLLPLNVPPHRLEGTKLVLHPRI